MHRSRVYAVLIDTPTADAGRATDFWSAALGVSPRRNAEHPQFTELPDGIPGVVTAIQAVGSAGTAGTVGSAGPVGSAGSDGSAGAAPRIHLDIETDDVEAEVARLVGLGAVREAQWQECRILRAPGGHVLCVLPIESDRSRFDAEANTWP